MDSRLEKLEKLLAADPKDPFVLYGLAQEHGKLGHVEQACSLYDRCLEADPNYCYAYYHKAKLLGEHDLELEAIGTINAGIAVAKACNDGKALGELQGLLDSLT